MSCSLFPSQPLPKRTGVGLKPEHQEDIFTDTSGRVSWFEIHAENYMGAGGPPHAFLSRIRSDYPLSVHGVGLSIGGPQPLDEDHLSRLKAVVERYEPGLFSEHLAWSTHDTTYMNDLLPLPYTEETLQNVCDHIDQVQTKLQRQMLLENPSTYIAFVDNDMDEVSFLKEIVRRTGCGLLLDVNNVYVSSTNHQRDPYAYLDSFPLEAVGEIHLGGHAEDEDDEGARLLIDSHNDYVTDPVWRLYEHTIRKAGPRPTLIEWDSDIPAWAELYAEAQRADRILERYH